MRGWWIAAMVTVALLTTTQVSAADSDVPKASQIVASTRFLEDHPLDQRAPVIRAALLQWEAASKDVVDVVCPGVFAPLPDDSIKYNGELLAQFIFGSAAHQLATPEDKGKLMPAQLAGMTSMLKAYRVLLATDGKVRIPRFDELSHDEANGSLVKTLEPLVIANCLPKETGKSRFPWTLGMSKAQVSAVTGYGPYRSFKNGDLETYNAVFDSHFRNFQFFFRDNKLWRIGVYTFEGTDLSAATQAWGDMYESMRRTFGAIETPVNKAPVEGDADSMKAFQASARTLVEQSGRAQLAPLQQPAAVYSFASFSQSELQDTTIYYITLFFDAPHDTSKATVVEGDK